MIDKTLSFNDWFENNGSAQTLEDKKDKNMNVFSSFGALLTSYRFWGVVGTSASFISTRPEFVTDKWYVSLVKFLGSVILGATLIRTADRVGDKNIEASQISAGVPVNPPSSPM